jgi:hypothetical protein
MIDTIQLWIAVFCTSDSRFFFWIFFKFMVIYTFVIITYPQMKRNQFRACSINPILLDAPL